jgi:hypothetical protein
LKHLLGMTGYIDNKKGGKKNKKEKQLVFSHIKQLQDAQLHWINSTYMLIFSDNMISRNTKKNYVKLTFLGSFSCFWTINVPDLVNYNYNYLSVLFMRVRVQFHTLYTHIQSIILQSKNI